MKKILLPLISVFLLSHTLTAHADQTKDISEAGITSPYIGTWHRADQEDDDQYHYNYNNEKKEQERQTLKIERQSADEFSVELTKPKVKSRYSQDDKITYQTKKFVAILKNGVLHIDNGGMEVTTLRYDEKTQSIRTTQSWSFPNGIFNQTGSPFVQPYQQYQIKETITEGLSLGSSAKISIAEYYANFGEFPVDNNSAGLEEPEKISTKRVKSVTVLPQGRVVIAFTERINPQAQASITLAARINENRTAITWTCSAENIEPNLLPQECRPENMQSETASPAQARKIISEGLMLASSAKVAMAEYYAGFAKYPQDNYSAGLAEPEAFVTKGVKSVTVMPQGNIVIAYSNLINSQAQASITLTMGISENGAAFIWTCSAENINPNLLPQECKAQ